MQQSVGVLERTRGYNSSEAGKSARTKTKKQKNLCGIPAFPLCPTVYDLSTDLPETRSPLSSLLLFPPSQEIHLPLSSWYTFFVAKILARWMSAGNPWLVQTKSMLFH